MIIKKTVRAINTAAVFQDTYGEQYQIPADYLSHVIRDDGTEEVVPLKVISLADIEGYVRFDVKDPSGKTISFDEIEASLGD